LHSSKTLTWSLAWGGGYRRTLAIFRANVVAFRIPNYIFVGPIVIEFLYELFGLLKFFAGSHEKEFAITKFRKDAIHSAQPPVADTPVSYLSL
jgi:hypothetical protein